ncbi:type II toxin-antitoxin system RelE/ParE family toxin [Paraburkholderia sp. EG304]
MIVEWRPRAREDRSRLFDYIAQDNPTAALELALSH